MATRSPCLPRWPPTSPAVGQRDVVHDLISAEDTRTQIPQSDEPGCDFGTASVTDFEDLVRRAVSRYTMQSRQWRSVSAVARDPVTEIVLLVSTGSAPMRISDALSTHLDISLPWLSDGSRDCWMHMHVSGEP